MRFLSEIAKYVSLISIAIAAIIAVILVYLEIGAINSENRVLRKIKIFNKQSNYVADDLKLKDNIRSFMRIFLMVIISRAALILFTTLWVQLSGKDNYNFFDALRIYWNRWDSPHYLEIAKNWYTTHGDSKYLIVFFPFYPMVIKAFAFVFHDYIISAMLVSNLCLSVACFYLYNLLRLDFKEDINMLTIVFLISSPFAFFLSGAYSESLFLALTISCMYYIRLHKWFTAALLGYFAALTRNTGVIIAIPYLIELLSYNRRLILNGMDYIKSIKYLIKNLVKLVIIPIGTITYLLINKTVTGDYFKFLEYEKEHWNQSFGFFPDNIQMHFMNIFHDKREFSALIWAPQVISFFIAVFLICYTLNKIRVSYTIYAIICLIIYYSPTWLLSGPRYILTLFPIYIGAAVFARRLKLTYSIMFISTILLFVFTVAYVSGHSIM